ncbi:hypothetical protein CDAR_609821 [Caerostris darwini]|uniref:Uncharacterized protein n=1 Tax=Caerostris darwini TaxID=1538125 RepID=A0AAV4VRN3_9ARAC|nr:hypothetical protein CDAR_609821 [Caerostris darwini]
MALFRAKCNTFARRRLHARLGNQRSPAPATLERVFTRGDNSPLMKSLMKCQLISNRPCEPFRSKFRLKKCPVIRFQITKTSWRSWNTFLFCGNPFLQGLPSGSSGFLSGVIIFFYVQLVESFCTPLLQQPWPCFVRRIIV